MFSKIDHFLKRSFLFVVSIGYEYMNCNQIDWYRKSVKMTGQDIPTANIGGWTFNVHHKLNLQAGIYQN